VKRKKLVEVTDRDLKILKFVFEHRAVSFKQIGNKFFCGASLPTIHVRLDILRKAGLLIKSYVLWKEKRTVVFGITEKGVKQFSDTYFFEITTPNFRSDSITHDLGLVLLRERLEKTKMVVEYLSESMLQSCG